MVDRDGPSALVRVIEARTHLGRADEELPDEYDDVACLLEGVIDEVDVVREVLEAAEYGPCRWEGARDSDDLDYEVPLDRE